MFEDIGSRRWFRPDPEDPPHAHHLHTAIVRSMETWSTSVEDASRYYHPADQPHCLEALDELVRDLGDALELLKNLYATVPRPRPESP
jgi:hypothetical protein